MVVPPNTFCHFPDGSWIVSLSSWLTGVPPMLGCLTFLGLHLGCLRRHHHGQEAHPGERLEQGHEAGPIRSLGHLSQSSHGLSGVPAFEPVRTMGRSRPKEVGIHDDSFWVGRADEILHGRHGFWLRREFCPERAGIVRLVAESSSNEPTPEGLLDRGTWASFSKPQCFSNLRVMPVSLAWEPEGFSGWRGEEGTEIWRKVSERILGKSLFSGPLGEQRGHSGERIGRGHLRWNLSQPSGSQPSDGPFETGEILPFLFCHGQTIAIWF